MATKRQGLVLWGSLLRVTHRRAPGAPDSEFWAVAAHACCFNDMSRRQDDPDSPPPAGPGPPEPDGLDWRLEAEYQRRVGPLTGINYDKVQQAGTSLRGTTAQPSGPESIAKGNVLKDAMPPPAPPGPASERSGDASG